MKYRHATILAAKSLSAAGTETLNLDTGEVLSRIDIRFKITKSKGAMDAHPAADITKIELVDGSDVLHSLSGYENQALAMYSRRVPTMCHGQHISGSSEETVYGIDFGRFLWDSHLAFDPKKFTKPQLKITYVLNLCDTGASAGELEVFGHFFDMKPVTPIGFLMAKEHYSYTPSAADAYEDIILPTDYPIRQMLLRAFHSGHEPWDAIDEARLDEENLKRIVFDHDNLENYYRVNKGMWLPNMESMVGIASAGGVIFFVTPSDYWCTVAVTPQGNSPDVYMSGSTMTGGKVTLISAAATQFTGIVHGYLPNHCYQFPFGMQDDVDDWYDVTGLKRPRLRLRAGTSGNSGTGEVVLEQLRRY